MWFKQSKSRSTNFCFEPLEKTFASAGVELEEQRAGGTHRKPWAMTSVSSLFFCLGSASSNGSSTGSMELEKDRDGAPGAERRAWERWLRPARKAFMIACRRVQKSLRRDGREDP